MFAPTTSPKVGDRFTNKDERTADLYKNGKVKARRTVEIIALPTLSTLGVMRVVKAPRNGVSQGQLRRFTLAKLEQHYDRV